MGQVGIPGMSGLMCKIGLNSELVNLCLCPGSSNGRRV